MTEKAPPRLMYLLPNLITLSAMGCGLVAVTVAAGEQAFGSAAAFVFAAALLDSLDGRIARMTGTQSEFGVQLDSLSDAIAFGVAPALLMHTFALHALGHIGLFACCAYAACAIVRLARFNIQAVGKDKPGRFMVGLSVPVSAAVLIALIGIDVTTSVTLSGDKFAWELTIAMAVLGALMVSTVPFRSFKDMKLDASTIAIILFLLASSIGVSIAWSPAIALACLLAIYLLQGFVELGRRLLRS